MALRLIVADGDVVKVVDIANVLAERVEFDFDFAHCDGEGGKWGWVDSGVVVVVIGKVSEDRLLVSSNLDFVVNKN